MQLLDLDPALVENRHSQSRQEKVECGFFVMHYIEEFARRAASQAPHSQGWPSELRLSRIVQYLQRMIKNLEIDRLAWVQEIEETEKAHIELEKTLEAKAEKFVEKNSLLARVVQAHRTVALELLDQGASVEPPKLDAEFVLRFEKHQRFLAEQRELRRQARLEALKAAEADPSVEPPPLPPPAPEVEPEPVPDDVIAKLIKECEENKDLNTLELAIASARVEDLGKEQQEHFKRVEATGKGICSRCRYRSGCLNCDVEKAWRYVVKWELGLRVIDVVSQAIPGPEPPKPAGGGGPVEALWQTLQVISVTLTLR